MSKIVCKEDVAKILAKKTGFYIKNMRDVCDALEEIIPELLMSATVDEPVEIKLCPGLIISGKRVPEHESIDPRTRNAILTPEKVIPKAVFKPSFRQKLYVRDTKKKKNKKG